MAVMTINQSQTEAAFPSSSAVGADHSLKTQADQQLLQGLLLGTLLESTTLGEAVGCKLPGL